MKLSTESLHGAAQWYATLLDEEATEADRANWHQWLEQDEQNRRAWSEIEAISAQLQPLQGNAAQRQAASGALQRSHKTTHSRRSTLRALWWLSGTALASWLGWQYTPLRRTVLAQLADEASPIGQVRQLQLADGSVLWLNSASAVDIAMDAHARVVTLRYGEVLIETAKDPSRAFFVKTTHGQLQALGTRFSVALETEQTTLTVFDGQVSVRTANAAVPDSHAATPEATVVNPGERLRFDQLRLQPPQAASSERNATAWTRGVLVANGMPLGQLAQMLERFRPGRIHVDDSVADLRVLGTYPLHDTDKALALIAQSLPVRVQHPLPWWVAIRAQ